MILGTDALAFVPRSRFRPSGVQPEGKFFADHALTEGEDDMAESVYKVIELIGTSKESWEKAASAAVERAGKTLRELRVAEVAELDLQLDDKGKIEAYRAKLRVSFKFED
jgi:flavin-binding protein dodecin